MHKRSQKPAMTSTNTVRSRAWFPLVFLLGPIACQPSGTTEDAGGAAPDGGPIDMSDAGGGLDGGSPDSGGMDGGHLDSGVVALDGGSPNEDDAGFVCVFPGIEPPDPVVGDGGAPECNLGVSDGTGSFAGTWEGDVEGDIMLVGPFSLPAAGDMVFDVVCTGDKLLIDGELTGEAENPQGGAGFPFSGRIYGEFYPLTGQISLVVNPATLVLSPFEGTFKVTLSGSRTNDAFDDGSWCGVTIEPPGGHGAGTWTAALVE